ERAGRETEDRAGSRGAGEKHDPFHPPMPESVRSASDHHLAPERAEGRGARKARGAGDEQHGNARQHSMARGELAFLVRSDPVEDNSGGEEEAALNGG